MKSAFFWDIKQRKVVIPYRHIVKGQEFQEFSLKVTCIFLIRMDIFMIIITVFNNIFPICTCCVQSNNISLYIMN